MTNNAPRWLNGHKFDSFDHLTRRNSRPRDARKMVVPEHVYSAATNGDVAVLREYFASGDRDPNDVVARNGWTLLDGACRGKKAEDAVWGVEARDISCETISFLLSQGASFDYHHRSPRGRWNHRQVPLGAPREPLYVAAPVRTRSRRANSRADRFVYGPAARRRSRGTRVIGTPLRVGPGTRHGPPAPDAVRASRRARIAYYAAPPRRLQARALFLAVEARLVVVPMQLGPVRLWRVLGLLGTRE